MLEHYFAIPENRFIQTPCKVIENSGGFWEHNNFKGEYDIQKVEGFTAKILCEVVRIS